MQWKYKGKMEKHSQSKLDHAQKQEQINKITIQEQVIK